jgi:transcriptional regulator with XRE-family HTH domain
MSAPDWPAVAVAFGQAVKLLRTGAGLSQRALAKAAGITLTFLGRLERGLQQPALATLLSIAAALPVDPVVLLRMTMWRLALAKEQP